MKRIIRILEIPILLLAIAIFCIEKQEFLMSMFLMLVSIFRLVVNVLIEKVEYE